MESSFIETELRTQLLTFSQVLITQEMMTDWSITKLFFPHSQSHSLMLLKFVKVDLEIKNFVLIKKIRKFLKGHQSVS